MKISKITHIGAALLAMLCINIRAAQPSRHIADSGQNVMGASPTGEEAEISRVAALRWRWQAGTRFRIDARTESRKIYPNSEFVNNEEVGLACEVLSVDEFGNANISVRYENFWADAVQQGNTIARFGSAANPVVPRGWDAHDWFYQTVLGNTLTISVCADGTVTSVSGADRIRERLTIANSGTSGGLDSLVQIDARYGDAGLKGQFTQYFRVPAPRDAPDGWQGPFPTDWLAVPPSLALREGEVSVHRGAVEQAGTVSALRAHEGIVTSRATVEQIEVVPGVKEKMTGGWVSDELLFDTTTGRGAARSLSNTLLVERSSPDGKEPTRVIKLVNLMHVEWTYDEDVSGTGEKVRSK